MTAHPVKTSAPPTCVHSSL